MELQGKIIAVLPERSGVSQRGEWKSQDFVIETHDQYPRKMVFSVFGADRLQRFNIQAGAEMLVAFDIDAHEYNGRWFNNIRAYDVRPADPNAVEPVPAQDPFATPAPQAAPAAPQAQPFQQPAPAAPQAQAQAAPAQDAPFAPAPEGDDPDNLPF